MRKETLSGVLAIVGICMAAPVCIYGVYEAISAVRAGKILDRIKFEREMQKGIREGRILKLHGEYFTILEDGTRD